MRKNIISFTVIALPRARRNPGAAPRLTLLWPPLLAAFGATACAVRPITQRHDWPSVPPASLETPGQPVIVVGFVGGLVKHDNPIRSEVKLAEHLRTEYPAGVHVQTFENRHREEALRAILAQLGADGSGMLSENQKRRARIILYGHSWGGSAMVELARELEKRGIPVLLTVQVDSVKRFGVDDGVIPRNVARAANFYQPDGMVHGREVIRAADPTKTQILGNFRLNYKEHPIHCPEYPWYDRIFAKTHTEMDCDPAVWSRVEALIRAQISSARAKQD